jgi:hypothetical protein
MKTIFNWCFYWSLIIYLLIEYMNNHTIIKRHLNHFYKRKTHLQNSRTKHLKHPSLIGNWRMKSNNTYMAICHLYFERAICASNCKEDVTNLRRRCLRLLGKKVIHHTNYQSPNRAYKFSSKFKKSNQFLIDLSLFMHTIDNRCG